MGYNPILSSEVDVDSPGKAELFQKIKENFDYLYSKSAMSGDVLNGSLDLDTDADGVPDNWTLNLYPNGAGEFDESTPSHGVRAFKFTRVSGSGNGGGYLESSYIEISPLDNEAISVDIKSSVAGIKNIVKIRYFDKDKTYISDENVYNSTSNPTSWTKYYFTLTIPSTARYYKIQLIGGYTDTDVAGIAYFDNVRRYIKTNQSLLKTTYGEVSGYGNLTLPGGEYGFYPRVKSQGGRVFGAIGFNYTSSSYATLISFIYQDTYDFLIKADAGYTGYALQRYVTSSAKEHWVFLLYDKTNRKMVGGYSAPDHPCANNGGDLEEVPHPFADYWDKQPLPKDYEIVVLDMKSTYEVKEKATRKRGILEIIQEEYEIDDTAEKEWQPRDIDGTKTMVKKNPLYTIRGLRKKTKEV